MTRYTITGPRCANFPLPMLRFAESWPATDDDAMKIDRSVRSDWGAEPKRQEIVLHTNQSEMARDLSEKRWASFGWTILKEPASPKYKQEFPDFDHELPVEWFTEHGFEDGSWRNDTCPCFICDVFVLFIDYKDPTLREEPVGPLYSMRCEDEDMLATDNWEDVRAFVEDGKRDFPEWVPAATHA